jgi:hypothetical protein
MYMMKLIIMPLAALMLMATVMPNVFASHSVDPQACYNDGTTDGENNEFSQDFYEFCQQYGENYYDGFIDGCMSQDNSRDVCESATDAE